MPQTLRDRAVEFFQDLQDHICAALGTLDGTRFRQDEWSRPGGGGGRSRVLADDSVFEKAGVNYSDVFGDLNPDFAAQLPGDGPRFSATGISLVLHPRNPYAPTVHANFRHITHGATSWFGGGADLTPYYLFVEDAIHFHLTWKSVCDQHAAVADYQRMKNDCDRYFFLPHRAEHRGVGGIFFDDMGSDPEAAFAFVCDAGNSFLNAYQPIIEKRCDTPYGNRERRFQLYRRGRYVEFNLLHDRGTLFGLKTAGRIESILMSLPPLVRFDYDWYPEPGSPEAELLEVIRTPRDWANQGELTESR